MISRNRTSAFILFSILVMTCACRNSPAPHALRAGDFTITKRPIGDLFRFGIIEKIVVPELTDDSSIAEVSQIAFDKNGDIYVADLSSRGTVLRFDESGKYLSRYGRPGQGPGEHGSLRAFDIDRDSQVYLISDTKIMRYSQAGEFEKETLISYFPGDIKIVKDGLYARIFRTKDSSGGSGPAIKVYDLGLAELGSVSHFDPRLSAYLFLPRSSITVWKDKIIFTDIYDLALNIYDPRVNQAQRIVFPNDNGRLDSVWKREHLVEDDRSHIRDNIHRFNAVYSFDGIVYLTEIVRERNEVNFWLMDIDHKKIVVFPLLDVIGTATRTSASIRFDTIVGTYENGLVFVVEDEEKIQKIREQYPQFKDVRFGANDNPALVFFRVNGIS
ncbi:MAG TPA: 6-bladed beta-propeller [Candidatus Latescibacteria bacterium]|nr:6-bladed beta-propeller [Candidatus Latescibacterota bacterium]